MLLLLQQEPITRALTEGHDMQLLCRRSIILLLYCVGLELSVEYYYSSVSQYETYFCLFMFDISVP